MRSTLLLLLAATAALAEPLPGFRWTHWNDVHTLVSAAPAPLNGIYVAGRTEATQQNPRSVPFIHRLDADGLIRWTVQPPELHTVAGMTSDAAGNLYVTGSQTRSAAIGGIWTVGALTVLNTDGRTLRTHLFPRDTTLLNVALDASGTAWVVGSIRGTFTSFGGPTYGFLGKVISDGTASIVRQVGGDRRLCFGGSGCIGAFGFTQLTEIAVGPGGAIAAGGVTTSNNMAVSSNAVQPQSNGGGVLLVVDASANPLVETYIGGSPQYIGAITCPVSRANVTGLVFDRDGTLFVSGTNSGVRPKTTEGALQTSAPDVDCNAVTPVGFLYGLDPRTAAIRFSTLLGGDTGSAAGIVSHEDGVLLGGTASSVFPVTPGEFTRGPGVLATISRDGRSVVQSAKLPAGIEGRPIAAPNGRTFVLNEHAVSAFTIADPKSPVVFGAANAAGKPLAPHIVPGEVLSLYGNGIGPAEPQHLKLAWDGTIDTNLAGVRVFFDGIAAPLLYADSEQINLMVPFGIWRGAMQLVRDDRVVLQQAFPILMADPAFLGSCWNAEGKLNSAANPASPGETLACWISGLGMLTPIPVDGSLPLAVLPKLVSPITATAAERPLEIEYLGQAPLVPAGVVQINFRTPGPEWTGRSTADIQVTAGSRTASTTIWLRESTVP